MQPARLYRITGKVFDEYWAISGSMVTSVNPSTVACATSILSNGSLWIGGRLSTAAMCRG
jgi:hypothetical protein